MRKVRLFNAVLSFFCRKVVLLTLFLLTLSVLKLSRVEVEVITITGPSPKNLSTEKFDHAYENDQACHFPILNPFDPSIMQFVKHPEPLECKFMAPEFTFAVENSVILNATLVAEYSMEELQYRTIARSAGTDMSLQYSDWIKFESKSVEISGNGIQVKAKYLQPSTGKTMWYWNIHGSVKGAAKSNKASDGEVPATGSDNDEALNVVILGIDSVSRSNFLRNLPLTYKYLTSILGGWDLRGYSKIDDNTFPNMLAVLSGYKVTVNYAELTENPREEYVDEWPFIWKNFSSKGYKTMLAEEQPGIFSYKAKGFRKPPTDVYMRPFGLLMNNMPLYDQSGKHCFGNKPESQIFLDHVKRFMQLYRSEPYFAFSFLWKLSHDFASRIEILDVYFAQWLKEIKEEGLLETTALFVMSDHGSRFDEIRSTLIGRYEERMPFMFLHMPTRWKANFPKAVAALDTNTRRLTCQFDVFETLVDILNQDYGSDRPTLFNRGVSLFREVPKSRVCQDIQVQYHFCVCQIEKSIPADDVMVKEAAEYVVKQINTALKPVQNLCEQVKLVSVRSAQEYAANDRVKYNNRWHYRHYLMDRNVTQIVTYLRVTLLTKPNGGVFEALVQRTQADPEDISTATLNVGIGDISRINPYGDAAACVSLVERKLEKFCTCRQ